VASGEPLLGNRRMHSAEWTTAAHDFQVRRRRRDHEAEVRQNGATSVSKTTDIGTLTLACTLRQALLFVAHYGCDESNDNL